MSEANFHQQIAQLAQSWFALAQSSIRWRDRITPTQTLAHQPADMRGVLACAVELARLLDSHPEARKALPDLAGAAHAATQLAAALTAFGIDPAKAQ